MAAKVMINKALWHRIDATSVQRFVPSDIEPIVEAVGCSPDEVLAVLALLSRPSLSLLKMEYVALGPSGETEIPPSEVAEQIRKSWKEKSLSEQEWRIWASDTRVQWRPAVGRRGA